MLIWSGQSMHADQLACTLWKLLHPSLLCALGSTSHCPHCHALMQYHTSPLTALRFAPRSMLLATAARDGTLALWSVYQS